MRIHASAAIISVMAVLIAVLLWAVVYFARDEWHLKAETRDDNLPVHANVGNEEGFATVRVSEQGQRASGIATREVEEASVRASAEVYGTVVNIQPLHDLHAPAQAKGLLQFNHYDQCIYAALAGQGMALGRAPLITSHLADGRLVPLTPPRPTPGQRAYSLLRSKSAQRPEGEAFAEWLIQLGATADAPTAP